MRIIALSTLKAFWEDNREYLDAKEPILAWYRFSLKADWSTPAEVKQDFRNASILKDGRVVFNIAGNKYRLVVWINYAYRIKYIRFIGTHAQTDKIAVQTIWCVNPQEEISWISNPLKLMPTTVRHWQKSKA